MNKTILAAAIDASIAAPMAVAADVTISGAVEQTFASEIDTLQNGMEGYADNFLKFYATEDLGDGLTAFAQIMLDPEAGVGTKDNIVGLKGDFGTAFTGRFEPWMPGMILYQMTLQFDAVGVSSSARASVEPDGIATGRTDNGYAYMSPSFSGLTVGIGGFSDVGTNNANVDAYDLIVAYDNAGLSLKVGYQETDNASDTTAVSAFYKMDNMKFGVLWADEDSDTGVASDQTDISYRFDYTMGNNNITLAYKDNEDASATGSVSQNDVIALELNHSFSKRTNAYAGYVDVDEANGSTQDLDYFYAGMRHSF